MTISFIILEILPKVGNRLSIKFNKIWVLAEIILFVLVGAQVNINVALDSFWIGVLILFLGLIARSLGVYISLIGTNLNLKEKIFTMRLNIYILCTEYFFALDIAIFSTISTYSLPSTTTIF